MAILVEAAGALAREPPARRGVILAFFDGEEPPHFLADGMGSEWYAAHPTVPLDRIDAMLCMDLVGHAVGGPHFPAEVRDTVFALGAERSAGTAAHLDALADAEPGVWLRRLTRRSSHPSATTPPSGRRGSPSFSSLLRKPLGARSCQLKLSRPSQCSFRHETGTGRGQ